MGALVIACVALMFMPFLQHINAKYMHKDVGESEDKSCDLYKGKWVYDKSYPLYNSKLCNFLGVEFDCQKNGRPDKNYLKYRWQPSTCDLPKFNGQDFLRRFINKKIMFVGDSLGMNQWESLSCMLHTSMPNSDYTTERVGSISSIIFPEYNVSVMYERNALLVEIEEKRYGKVLKLDSINGGKRWKATDVLVFNSWLWWPHKNRKQPWNFIKDGQRLYGDMNRPEAYEKALYTWANWVDKNIGPKKTKVFFLGITPTHSNASHWGNHDGKNCSEETRPLLVPPYPRRADPAEVIVEKVLKSMSKPVNLLNVTKLSLLRKDAHPSRYGYGGHYGMDCTHWCLAGVPDTWNQLLYAELVGK